MRQAPLKARIIRRRDLRAKVLERDQGRCARCGRYDPKFEVDHIVALWSGGKDELDNVQTLCRHCHTRKTVGEAPLRAKADRIRQRHDLTKRRRALKEQRP